MGLCAMKQSQTSTVKTKEKYKICIFFRSYRMLQNHAAVLGGISSELDL